MRADSMPLCYLLAAMARRLLCGFLGHAWQWCAAANIRTCTRCLAATELVAAPPAAHPESLTAELDDSDEEYLAWLDAQLSPEEAA